MVVLSQVFKKVVTALKQAAMPMRGGGAAFYAGTVPSEHLLFITAR